MINELRRKADNAKKRTMKSDKRQKEKKKLAKMAIKAKKKE